MVSTAELLADAPREGWLCAPVCVGGERYLHRGWFPVLSFISRGWLLSPEPRTHLGSMRTHCIVLLPHNAGTDYPTPIHSGRLFDLHSGSLSASYFCKSVVYVASDL